VTMFSKVPTSIVADIALRAEVVVFTGEEVKFSNRRGPRGLSPGRSTGKLHEWPDHSLFSLRTEDPA
jgi:hypothetical protein